MSLKRVITILAASYEFHKKRNAEIVERYTDSEEIYSVKYILQYFIIFYYYIKMNRMYYIYSGM